MEKLLSQEIWKKISEKAPQSKITEIRLRLGKRIFVKTVDNDFFISDIVREKLITAAVMVATDYSQYSFEKEISEGYIPYREGIRIGIVGSGKINEHGLIAYKNIYCLNIRIPHQIFSCANGVYEIINDFDSTLVISPPYGGKTTLIREMARLLSQNHDTLIVDERFELCGEKCSLEQGERCDIIQGVPKSLVFENIIRTMSPEIVVCDELFGKRDFEAVARMVSSGIKCLATYHATSLESLPRALRGLFFNIITLNSKPRVGSIISIYRGKND